MISTIMNIIYWIIGLTAIIIIGSLIFWKTYFLRKPKREIPKKGLVSPADGKIIKIIQYDKKGRTVRKGVLGKVKVMTKDVAEEGNIIVIMMTITNAHYQRAPYDGDVEKIRYSKGTFLNAVKGAEDLKATFENEKNEILIKTKKGRIKVIQVAGILARRIESYTKPKQKIHKGEVLGRINLGSQVILITPKTKLEVKEGDKVVDGETIMAKWE